MPATWREMFVVPYGAGDEQLGLSRGGERGAPVLYGPEYAAPAPDKSWWFLDVAKKRLAHFDASGAFLDDVVVPPRLLVDRRFFSWQLPHVLADGTLVAFRYDGGAGAMLRLRDGNLDEVPLTIPFFPTYDDGKSLYGAGADGALMVLDPRTGGLGPTSAYHSPSGTEFTFAVDFDAGSVRLGTATTDETVRLVTRSGAVAHAGVQVRVGIDDSLHLFVAGISDDSPSNQLVGYISAVDVSGGVARAESLATPFSETDRGTPAQLAIAPGDTVPMLIYIQPDGVHIYRRTA